MGFSWFALILLGTIGQKAEQGSTTPAAAGTEVAAATQPASAALAPQPVPQQPAAIAITARERYQAYDQNEIAADQQFKGQTLEVTGNVESIDSDMSDEPVVRLDAGTGTYIEGMRIPGPGNISVYGIPTRAAAAINKGQSITVICTGSGEVVGDPQLRDCALK